VQKSLYDSRFWTQQETFLSRKHVSRSRCGALRIKSSTLERRFISPFRMKAISLRSICEETLQKLTAHLTQIQQGAPDPLKMPKASHCEYVKFGLRYPPLHYRVTFLAPHCVHDFEHYDDTDSAGRQAFELLCAAVSRCIRAGKLRPLDVQAASQVLWAGVHDVTSLFIDKSSFPFVERNKLIRLPVDTVVQTVDIQVIGLDPD
jgi:hypothetical protein